MKNKIILLVGIFVAIGITLAFAYENSKTEKFKVSGNCGMCESRIEEATQAVDGVSSADWNKETQMVEVTFDQKKTDVHNINMAIAEAGHDTEMHTASEEAYNELHGCCKYERTSKTSNEMHKGHSESGCTRFSQPSSCCG